MKCSTPRCRRQAAFQKTKCECCRRRRWRERHPIAARFADHVRHARERGIAVLWDRAEFAAWCVLTGYHLLDGHEIHRRGDAGPYSFNNCECIPKHDNAQMGAFKRWHKKTLAM